MERPRSSRNCLDMFDPNALSVKNKFRHIDMNLDNTDFTIPERSIDEALNCTQTKKVDGMGEWGLHKQIGSKHDPNRYKPQPAPPSPKRQYDIQFTQIHDSDDAMPTSSLSSLNIPNTSTVNNSPIAELQTPKSRQSKLKLPLTPSSRLRQQQVSNVNRGQLHELQNKFVKPLSIAKNKRHQGVILNGFSPMIASTPCVPNRVRKSDVPGAFRSAHPEINDPLVSSTDEFMSIIEFSNRPSASTDRQERVSVTASKSTTPPPHQEKIVFQMRHTQANSPTSLTTTVTTNEANVTSSEQTQAPMKAIIQQSFIHQSPKQAIIQARPPVWQRQKHGNVASSTNIYAPETPKASVFQSRIPKLILVSTPSNNLPDLENETPKKLSRINTLSKRSDNEIVTLSPQSIKLACNSLKPNITVTLTVNNARTMLDAQEAKKSDKNDSQKSIPGEQNIAATYKAQTRQHQALCDSLVTEESDDIGCMQQHLVKDLHCKRSTSHIRPNVDDHNSSSRRALFHNQINRNYHHIKSPSTINERKQESENGGNSVFARGINRNIDSINQNEIYDVNAGSSTTSKSVPPQVSPHTNRLKIGKKAEVTANQNALTSKPVKTNRQMDKSVESVVHQEIILSPTDHSSDNNSTGNIENSAVEARVAEQELQPEICENLELSAKSNSSALSSNSSNKENSVPGLGLVAAIATQKSQLTKENQPNYNCKVALTRLRNDWENLSLYHRRQANLRESETFNHLEPPLIFRDGSIIDDIKEKTLPTAQKAFKEREPSFHKGKNTKLKKPQTVRTERAASIQHAYQESEPQNGLEIANNQPKNVQNEPMDIVQPHLTRSKHTINSESSTAVLITSNVSSNSDSGKQDRCATTSNSTNETKTKKNNVIKVNKKRKTNVDAIEFNNNNHDEQAHSDIDDTGTGQRKLRERKNKSERSWSTNRARIMVEALSKKSQKSHSEPQSKSRINYSQQIKRKTKSSRSKPNTSIVHEPDDEFDDGAENNVRPARKKPRSMDTKTQSKKSKSTSDAGDGQLNVSGQLSIDPLVFQEQCWLTVLFNRDTLNKSKQSEEVDLNFLTLPEGTIEFTKFASIGFIEVNGVEYGYFPSKNKTNGVMRFQPNAVKPMTTQSDSLMVLNVLAGTFVLTCGKEKNSIRGGCLIKIPGGIEYEVKCTDSHIGVILFYVLEL